MLGSVRGGAMTLGVKMKRPLLLIAVLAALGLAAQGALAFQEGAPASADEKPSVAVTPVEAPKSAEQPGKGLSLKTPELSLGEGSGTEVRIPGFGKVGVLPKLDFGLELLYGATETKGVPVEKTEPGDVQIRGTIKHRF